MKTAPARILIVEDNADLRKFLSEILIAHGYDVCEATTRKEGLYCVENEPFDIALLDIMLPKLGDGIEILKRIRACRVNIPVIMQTALTDDEYCIKCLKAGADDFIIKPVKAGPLLARIEAVARRNAGISSYPENILLRNGAFVHSSTREIEFPSGTLVRLTIKEMKLLQFLFTNQHRAVSTNELLINVWNLNPQLADSNCIPALVFRLRKKLDGVVDVLNLYGGNYQLKL